MHTALHIVCAVALIAAALLVVIYEPRLRRRLTNFRSFQVPLLVGAAVLVPLNIIEAALGTTGWRSMLVEALTLACLAVGVAIALSSRIVAPRTATPKRILAIGAHPDDLELACGGTLARMADMGHEVHALIMSRGAVGGDADVRPGEALAGATFLGIASTEVLDFPDTRLESAAADMVRAIEARLIAFDPHIILTHSANDQHQDHEAVHWATLRAGRSHHSILCFESPSVTRSFAPSVFVDIESYVDTKVAAIARHADQRGKPYMGSERVAGMAAFRGQQAKIVSAEGFEAVRVRAFDGVIS